MGVLEEVMQLKNQGMGEEDIVDNLQEQGYQPKQINDAINQANIKSAVSSEVPSPDTEESPAQAGQEYEQQGYAPSTQEMSAQGQTQDYSQQGYGQDYGQEQGYEQQQAYQPMATDSSTMIEIAKQVYSEKSRKLKESLDELSEFKAMAETKIDSMDKSLKRIEKIIDTLQIKVLEKVGSYGRELEATKKELEMVEDSMGKMSGKIASKHHTKKHTTSKHITHKKTSKSKTHKKSKKK